MQSTNPRLTHIESACELNTDKTRLRWRVFLSSLI